MNEPDSTVSHLRTRHMAVGPPPPGVVAFCVYESVTDDSLGCESLPVVGVLAKTVDFYHRKRDKTRRTDGGEPNGPPTAAQLRRDGYRYGGEEERFSVLVLYEERVIEADNPLSRSGSPEFEQIVVMATTGKREADTQLALARGRELMNTAVKVKAFQEAKEANRGDK